MERLTSQEVGGLMEAYNSIYAPQTEITEEQIWEEVEEWVNFLLDEGYDLSEYTWEDMYDKYINFETFELISSYLINEGYAENLESAKTIILNMSENWFNLIIQEESILSKPLKSVQSNVKSFFSDPKAIPGKIARGLESVTDPFGVRKTTQDVTSGIVSQIPGRFAKKIAPVAGYAASLNPTAVRAGTFLKALDAGPTATGRVKVGNDKSGKSIFMDK